MAAQLLDRRNRVLGIAGTVAVHMLVVAIVLLFASDYRPLPDVTEPGLVAVDLRESPAPPSLPPTMSRRVPPRRRAAGSPGTLAASAARAARPADAGRSRRRSRFGQASGAGAAPGAGAGQGGEGSGSGAGGPEADAARGWSLRRSASKAN